MGELQRGGIQCESVDGEVFCYSCVNDTMRVLVTVRMCVALRHLVRKRDVRG